MENLPRYTFVFGPNLDAQGYVKPVVFATQRNTVTRNVKFSATLQAVFWFPVEALRLQMLVKNSSAVIGNEMEITVSEIFQDNPFTSIFGAGAIPLEAGFAWPLKILQGDVARLGWAHIVDKKLQPFFITGTSIYVTAKMKLADADCQFAYCWGY